ncbi:MAG: P-type conjugative transfer protein TrbL, partial [Enterovibrio sp.]
MALLTKLKLPIFLSIAFALFAALPAHAEINSAGVLDSVLARYLAAASSWGSVITDAATRLFWTLVVISMIWTFGMMALRKADIGDFFAEFVRFTVFTGFFWWLLINGPAFASSIYDSLRQIAGEATGLGANLSPSGIIDVGFEIFNRVLDQSSFWSPVDSFAGIIMGLMILIILALIGVNMLLLLAASWVLAYGGVFFLGFGGSRWTSEMAINYYKTVLGIAAQLMAMVLLIGIGKTFLDDYYSAMSSGVSIKEMAVLLIVAVILLILVTKVPQMLAGIITGASVGSAGIGNFGAGAVLGAAGVASAGAAMGGAAMAAGASNIAGGAQALMAAFSKANQNVANGSDVLSSFFSGVKPSSASLGKSAFTEASGANDTSLRHQDSATTSAAASGNKDDPQTTSSDAATQGLARASRVAVDAGANLAKGAMAVAAAKVEQLKESSQQKIAQTLGGKIAAAIESHGAGAQEADNTSFAGNSLTSNGGSADGAPAS